MRVKLRQFVYACLVIIIGRLVVSNGVVVFPTVTIKEIFKISLFLMWLIVCAIFPCIQSSEARAVIGLKLFLCLMWCIF